MTERFAPSGPFEHHLRAAIALNQARAPRYAALSDGASRPISRRLIMLERAVLPIARWFDRRAAPYHQAGIPLLEEIFVPMASAPPFAAKGITPSPLLASARVRPLRPAVLRRRVRAAFRTEGFDGAADVLADALGGLAESPGTECLVRHLLESAYRLAALAPEHIQRATTRGLASPGPLLARLLRLHLWGLGSAAALDARARPLQARGIPILAQDLPPIPPPPRQGRR